MVKELQRVEITKPQLGDLVVRVKGPSLLMNKQTDAVKEKLTLYFEQRKGKLKAPKAIDEKQTEQEIAELKIHRDSEGRVAFPSAGFKEGMAVVASQFGLFKKDIYTGIIIVGDLIPITYREMQIHKGMGRTSGMGHTPIPTLRPLFLDWECELHIRYNASKFTGEDIANLLQHAGFYSGLGDWRPEKGGSFGQYELVNRE